MKTLSEAVQLAIIDQLGSTYRNLILSGYKEEHGNIEKLTTKARIACKKLVVVFEDTFKDMKV
jgi:hypothetical protein